MITYENQCVGCPPEMGCLGAGCRYQNVPVLTCDCCGDEVEVLYEFDGKEICGDCLLEKYPKIEL